MSLLTITDEDTGGAAIYFEKVEPLAGKLGNAVKGGKWLVKATDDWTNYSPISGGSIFTR